MAAHTDEASATRTPVATLVEESKRKDKRVICRVFRFQKAGQEIEASGERALAVFVLIFFLQDRGIKWGYRLLDDTRSGTRRFEW